MISKSLLVLLLAGGAAAPAAADTFSFGTNHLVVSVEGKENTSDRKSVV